MTGWDNPAALALICSVLDSRMDLILAFFAYATHPYLQLGRESDMLANNTHSYLVKRSLFWILALLLFLSFSHYWCTLLFLCFLHLVAGLAFNFMTKLSHSILFFTQHNLFRVCLCGSIWYALATCSTI